MISLLVAQEHHFRGQAGKVAHDRKDVQRQHHQREPGSHRGHGRGAAERGWEAVSLEGSPEFVRQAWIAANAHGLAAVGHTPTPGDREPVAQARARLGVGRAAEGTQRQGETITRVQAERIERTETGNGGRSASALSSRRQIAAAIETALLDGKVSPAIRSQVLDMMATEGARRMAWGDRIQVPVYDAQAPRGRAKTISASPQRLGDRQRSRCWCSSPCNAVGWPRCQRDGSLVRVAPASPTGHCEKFAANSTIGEFGCSSIECR